jgi:hypothetical protein
MIEVLVNLAYPLEGICPEGVFLCHVSLKKIF